MASAGQAMVTSTLAVSGLSTISALVLVPYDISSYITTNSNGIITYSISSNSNHISMYGSTIVTTADSTNATGLTITISQARGNTNIGKGVLATTITATVNININRIPIIRRVGTTTSFTVSRGGSIDLSGYVTSLSSGSISCTITPTVYGVTGAATGTSLVVSSQATLGQRNYSVSFIQSAVHPYTGASRTVNNISITVLNNVSSISSLTLTDTNNTVTTLTPTGTVFYTSFAPATSEVSLVLTLGDATNSTISLSDSSGNSISASSGQYSLTLSKYDNQYTAIVTAQDNTTTSYIINLVNTTFPPPPSIDDLQLAYGFNTVSAIQYTSGHRAGNWYVYLPDNITTSIAFYLKTADGSIPQGFSPAEGTLWSGYSVQVTDTVAYQTVTLDFGIQGSTILYVTTPNPPPITDLVLQYATSNYDDDMIAHQYTSGPRVGSWYINLPGEGSDALYLQRILINTMNGLHPSESTPNDPGPYAGYDAIYFYNYVGSQDLVYQTLLLDYGADGLAYLYIANNDTSITSVAVTESSSVSQSADTYTITFEEHASTTTQLTITTTDAAATVTIKDSNNNVVNPLNVPCNNATNEYTVIVVAADLATTTSYTVILNNTNPPTTTTTTTTTTTVAPTSVLDIILWYYNVSSNEAFSTQATQYTSGPRQNSWYVPLPILENDTEYIQFRVHTSDGSTPIDVSGDPQIWRTLNSGPNAGWKWKYFSASYQTIPINFVAGGSTTLYIVDNDTSLSDATFDGSPFSSYVCSISSESLTGTLTITPTDTNATVTINGVSGNSASVPCNSYSSESTVIVTAADQATSQTYTFTIINTTYPAPTTTTTLGPDDSRIISIYNNGVRVIPSQSTDPATQQVISAYTITPADTSVIQNLTVNLQDIYPDFVMFNIGPVVGTTSNYSTYNFEIDLTTFDEGSFNYDGTNFFFPSNLLSTGDSLTFNVGPSLPTPMSTTTTAPPTTTTTAPPTTTTTTTTAPPTTTTTTTAAATTTTTTAAPTATIAPTFTFNGATVSNGSVTYEPIGSPQSSINISSLITVNSGATILYGASSTPAVALLIGSVLTIGESAGTTTIIISCNAKYPYTAGSFSLVVTPNPTTTTTTQAVTTTTTTTNAPGQGPVCFLGHAPVATPTGSKRIDSLKEGDLVLTNSGTSVPIQRVKVMRCRPGPTTNPYIIAAGQFGATEELLISPRHKVAVVGGKMIEAKDLGLTQKAMKAPFNYYNIELPGWANMRVAGVEVESLAPAKRVVATVDQVQKAIAALPASQRTAETLKTLKRICQKTADGKIVVYGSF